MTIANSGERVTARYAVVGLGEAAPTRIRKDDNPGGKAGVQSGHADAVVNQQAIQHALAAGA